MPVFQHKNYEIYYEYTGDPRNPCMTFVNGLSMRTAHWAPFNELLPKQGISVLTYDMLGQGLSSKPILGEDFSEHVEILYHLHEHLNIKKPFICGISFGGIVVLEYAYRYAKETGGLIPISTFSELDPQLLGHAKNLYNALTNSSFHFYLELLLPLNFSNQWLAANEGALDVIERMSENNNQLYGIENLMESLSNFKSVTDQLENVICPTLILNAEYDILTPRHLHDIMRRKIKNSRMIVVPGYCHAFTLEIPQLTAKLLSHFVHSVADKTWQGDQSIWLAEETLESEIIARRLQGDILRMVPLPCADEVWS